jgi:hypothetical protein
MAESKVGPPQPDQPHEEPAAMQRPNDAKDPAAADGPTPMFTDAQMRKLKAAVIGMGVILLAGFALVIGRIVYLLNRPPVDASSNQRAAITTPANPAGPGATLATQAQLTLPEGAVIKHLSLSGDRIAVHYEAPAGQGIQILDLITGKPVQRIDITPGKSPR